MIKSKDEMLQRPLEIDLTGPEGNAFFLLARGKGLARSLGMDWKSIEDEMTAGDYEELVDVFDNYFGDYVTLYR